MMSFSNRILPLNLSLKWKSKLWISLQAKATVQEIPILFPLAQVNFPAELPAMHV